MASASALPPPVPVVDDRPAPTSTAGVRPTPATTRQTRMLGTLAVLAAATLAICAIAPLVGSTAISPTRVLDRSIPFAANVDAQIFWLARMPRVVAGALVGATLAAAGVVLQALLRNPLATPFTLGVSAGSSLGVMLAIIFGTSAAFGPLSAVPLASLAGAALATAFVYRLATRPGRPMSTAILILAGVTLNSFFSALILFAQYLADFSQVYRAARWLMGDLDVGGFTPIVAVLPIVGLAFGLFALLPSSLNLLSVGSEAAATRGVDVPRAQRIAFVSASLATSGAVALAGPIGFIGIVVPHLVRLLVGSDHRTVLPASALFGAAFLVACDMVARTVLAPVDLPVGVITALVGGPFFLWLLVRN